MLTGFRQFILRGNVIDLAVAVVIGVAFTGIVSSIVEGVINPAIGALLDTSDLATAFPVVIPTLSGGEPAVLYFGAVLAAIVNFLLVALVVYFALIVPVNALNKRAKARKATSGPVVEKPVATEIDLLVEIRDLLAKPTTDSAKQTEV